MTFSNPITHNQIALVTGAAGFIGRNVCRVLAKRGWIVLGLGHGDWQEQEYQQWGLSEWLNDDISLSSLTQITKNRLPDIIMHCAGSGSVQVSYTAPYKDFERTVCSTAVTLEFARNCCPPSTRVVIASSAAVYGDQGDIDFCETSPRNPISPYGFHKIASENMGESYSRFFGVQTSVVRLFSVYGEGLRKQLLWDAVNKFSNGQSQFFGTGNELRDWIHVEDAAQLLCLAAMMPQDIFEIYNGGHVQATTSEVLSLLAQCGDTGMLPQFNNEVHIGNPKRLTAKCSRAHEKLAWSPKIGLQQGLDRYMRWYKNQE